jgi:hypothetical protein
MEDAYSRPPDTGKRGYVRYEEKEEFLRVRQTISHQV